MAKRLSSVPYLKVPRPVLWVIPLPDGPVLALGRIICGFHNRRLFVALNTESTIGTQEQCSEEICPIAVRLQLPALTGEVPNSCHVDEALTADTVVVYDIKTMRRWLECILQAIPHVWIELISWRLIDLLDSYIKRHSRRRDGNIRDGNKRVFSSVGLAVRIRQCAEFAVVSMARVAISIISSGEVLLQLVQTIGLHELDPWVILVGVGTHSVINMPDEEPSAGKKLITSSRLSIFDKEVLRAVGIAIFPQTMNLEAGLDVSKRDGTIGVLRDDFDPLLIGLTP